MNRLNIRKRLILKNDIFEVKVILHLAEFPLYARRFLSDVVAT